MSRLFASNELTPTSSAPVPMADLGGREAPAIPPGPGTDQGEGGKQYLELLLKMIPGEVVSLYLFVINLVELIKSPAARPYFSWGLLGICIVLTPLVLALQEPNPGDPAMRRARRVRLWLAGIAFPVWAYGTAGDKLPVSYDPVIALIVVAVYSVVAGIVAKSVSPK